MPEISANLAFDSDWAGSVKYLWLAEKQFTETT